MPPWMDELRSCKLCSWECGVNRLSDEPGVCRVNLPNVATINMSLATRSCTVTFLGCNFRCIYCNAYRISQYPEVGWFYKGYIEPEELAKEVLSVLKSPKSLEANIDAVSFTGGEPTIHLPYIERLVDELRRENKDLRVGFATNGFASKQAMQRIIDLSSFINFEIKAYKDEIHKVLTGAPVEPVLKNAENLIKNAKDKIRVIRTVIIPGINDSDVDDIAEFIASIDPFTPYRIIGFRPNFMLYFHPGPSKHLMEKLTEKAKMRGLKNVSWSGYYPYKVSKKVLEVSKKVDYCRIEQAELASAYLTLAGCIMKPRDCGKCSLKSSCPAMLWQPWSLQDKLQTNSKEDED